MSPALSQVLPRAGRRFWRCGTGRWRQSIALTILTACLGTAACNEPPPTPAYGSAVELGRHLRIPKGVAQAKWEVVTLPEQGDASVPGPTDYVVLLAYLPLPRTEQKAITDKLPRVLETQNINRAFARSWMPRPAQDALLGRSGREEVHDASSFVKRQAKKALAYALPDGILIYVEYISP